MSGSHGSDASNSAKLAALSALNYASCPRSPAQPGPPCHYSDPCPGHSELHCRHAFRFCKHQAITVGWCEHVAGAPPVGRSGPTASDRVGSAQRPRAACVPGIKGCSCRDREQGHAPGTERGQRVRRTTGEQRPMWCTDRRCSGCLLCSARAVSLSRPPLPRTVSSGSDRPITPPASRDRPPLLP